MLYFTYLPGPIMGKKVPSYGHEMAGKSILFDSIDGAVELASSQNKVREKQKNWLFTKFL